MKFSNRTDAGKKLALLLKKYAGRQDVMVLGLPRGGIPVAYEIAIALNVPLDVFLVRKLGVPWQEELAMGAIALGGAKILNQDIIQSLNIPQEVIHDVVEKEMRELERRNLLYRDNLPLPELTHKTVILVDDGIATGATIRAAIAALKSLGCAQIIVATPVAPADTINMLHDEADEIFCIEMPHPFDAIGLWYLDFTQTTDAEVQNLLAAAKKNA